VILAAQIGLGVDVNFWSSTLAVDLAASRRRKSDD